MIDLSNTLISGKNGNGLVVTDVTDFCSSGSREQSFSGHNCLIHVESNWCTYCLCFKVEGSGFQDSDKSQRRIPLVQALTFALFPPVSILVYPI